MKTKFFYRGLFDKMQKKMVQTHNYHYTTQNFLQRMKNTIITKKIILMFITWAIFTTLCLDVLLKIFYHYWHKKTSKKTVEQYKSDQTFALMIQNAECLVFRNLENIVLNSSGCYTRWDISIIYSTVFYFFT